MGNRLEREGADEGVAGHDLVPRVLVDRRWPAGRVGRSPT
jgi:hypothetical protein